MGVSRITVRKALELLESQNIVIRNRGYGTYINDRLEYQLSVAHIKTPASLPVLVIRALAFDNNGKPVEYSINYCRSDVYVFFSE
ncbi:hypothetical protein B4923_10775 [Brenneria roseae subsp. americana]|uniref:HTH gntR-type domain-containing protein n=1 Tax=Brenneria roseae subsp. americana TaxID=1508507 RepID=A0A2U1TSE8_9GAMM|nr:GntR family transcriptional regulator [Brenneria roseae]PWC12321.1 hypothetical protein B4923_10775 [Brenneria roseae subsp. americana]